MATTGRYFYTPARQKRIGRRVTVFERIRRRYRRWKNREFEPDLYIVTGYFPPVYPSRR